MHFVFTTLGYHPDLAGGAYRYVTEMAEGLAARGHQVHAVYPGAEAGSELRNGVHLHHIAIQRGSFFSNWFNRHRAASDRLKTLRRENPKSLFVSCHAYLAAAAARSGGPMVSLFTGPWAEEFLQSSRMPGRRLLAPMLRRVERTGLKRSRAVFTISKYYEEKLQAWHPGLSRPVHVIKGGVNTEQFRPPAQRAELRTRLGIKPEEFLLLAVRRLESRMGLIDLVDSFQAVAGEFPKARLWIGGTGPLRAALEMRLRIFGLENRARLLGFIPEAALADHYGAVDCAVMPSVDLEGFGLSTVEALACGTPVIGTRRGATPEILAPLDKNLLYDAPADLAAKLRSILKTSTVLPSASACRAYALSRYAWSGPISAFERLCAQLPEAAK